jgi:hypothetical protein
MLNHPKSQIQKPFFDVSKARQFYGRRMTVNRTAELKGWEEVGDIGTRESTLQYRSRWIEGEGRLFYKGQPEVRVQEGKELPQFR